MPCSQSYYSLNTPEYRTYIYSYFFSSKWYHGNTLGCKNGSEIRTSLAKKGLRRNIQNGNVGF